MDGETTISHVKILNHPIETTIYKWLFRVPGQYYFGHISLIQKSDSAFGNPARPMSSPMQRLWMWLDRLREFCSQTKSQIFRSKKFQFNFEHSNLNTVCFLALIQFVDVLIFFEYLKPFFFKKTSLEHPSRKKNMNKKNRKISFHVRCEFKNQSQHLGKRFDNQTSSCQACFEAQIAVCAVSRLAAELHRSSMRWTDGVGRGGFRSSGDAACWVEMLLLLVFFLKFHEHPPYFVEENCHIALLNFVGFMSFSVSHSLFFAASKATFMTHVTRWFHIFNLTTAHIFFQMGTVTGSTTHWISGQRFSSLNPWMPIFRITEEPRVESNYQAMKMVGCIAA